MASVRKAYVVQQLHWEYNDNWFDLEHSEAVRAFADRDLAELHCAELEAAARTSGRTPVGFLGSLPRASSRSEAELVQELQSMYLPLPPRDEHDRLDWGDDTWWKDLLALLSDRSAPAYYQRFAFATLTDAESARLIEVGPEHVWALFDRLRFHEVLEIELEVP
jgi:hypothetical protein